MRPTKWTKSARHGWTTHTLQLVGAHPTVAIEVKDDGAGDVSWFVVIGGIEMREVINSASVRSAKRAAERWVETFARELLIGLGEESP